MNRMTGLAGNGDGRMKIVVATDSFKGSMTSLEAGNAVKQGILEVHPEWPVTVYPVADGGEGTVEALTYRQAVTKRDCVVTGPLGERIEASYLWYERGQEKTAVIEMAQAAGLPMVPVKLRNPLYTTTYGVGEMIRDAIWQGCRKFIIGIGGSSTNDAGVGMLQALGYHFRDEHGQEVPFGADGLAKIKEIGFDDVIEGLAGCRFQIACDVTNPLVGPLGCSVIYGPQKGATEQDIEGMDRWMGRFADLVERTDRREGTMLRLPGNRNTPGAGAAGGLGYAFLMFLGGILRPGIDIVLDEIGLEEEIAGADLVITGEGRMDAQTLMGKTPAGVAGLAQKHGIPVVAVAGCFGEGVAQCRESGLFRDCIAVDDILSEQERAGAMDTQNAVRNLRELVRQYFVDQHM